MGSSSVGVQDRNPYLFVEDLMFCFFFNSFLFSFRKATKTYFPRNYQNWPNGANDTTIRPRASAGVGKGEHLAPLGMRKEDYFLVNKR